MSTMPLKVTARELARDYLSYVRRFVGEFTKLRLRATIGTDRLRFQVAVGMFREVFGLTPVLPYPKVEELPRRHRPRLS